MIESTYCIKCGKTFPINDNTEKDCCRVSELIITEPLKGELIMENKDNQEEQVKAFIESMPYPIGSGRSYNDLLLEAVKFGESLWQSKYRKLEDGE